MNTQLLREREVYNRKYRLGPQITAAQKDLEDARNKPLKLNRKSSIWRTISANPADRQAGPVKCALE